MPKTENFHWNKEDYFPYLIHNNRSSTIALEYLVDDLHNGKEITIEKFLSHCGSEDFLWGLVKLMSYSDSRISGNSAYVLGTIAETENGTERIIELLNNQTNKDAKFILLYMINMLKSNDAECLMNAAGTIGTISESKLGREWLLSQDSLSEVIDLCTHLLDHSNLWVSSNAALVLARVSIDDVGCKALLYHESTNSILKKLINSLGNDDAGRGMNCAFAIGRLCDYEEGRESFLKLTSEMSKLISSLTIMIEQNQDYGCTKNACFALSCLASNENAHHIIIKHDSFEKLISSLCKLIVKVTDTETQWFAAMLIRVLASLPSGCIKLRSLNIVEYTLKSLLENQNLFSDVKEEVEVALDLLKRLEKPNPPKIETITATDISLSWDETILKNKLRVQYRIYNGTACVFTGYETTCKVTDLTPYTRYFFQLQLCTVEDDDRSAQSDPVEATTDESLPTEPLNLKCTGSTTSLLKIVWDAPEKMNGLLKGYFIFNGQIFIDQTNDLMYILQGLSPSTSYEIHVCAATSKGKGAKAIVHATTCEIGDLAPEKPTFGSVGRREMFIKWGPPQVISGKLNKYDLIMNGKCVYSGMALEYQITMLKPDTEYKFEVTAITNEGKFKSKVAKQRTLKDEYDPERAPLYPGPQNNNNIHLPGTNFQHNDVLTKKRILHDTDRIIGMQRQKTKIKLARENTKIKEKISTIDCEDFSSTSKQTLSDTLPNVSPVFKNIQDMEDITQRMLPSTIRNNTSYSIARPPLSTLISRAKEATSLVQRSGNNHTNKNISAKSLKFNPGDNMEPKNNNTTYYSFERSKTLGFNKPTNRGKIITNAVPTSMLSLNVKELQPEFPSLPNSSIPYYNVLNSSYNNSVESSKHSSPALSSTNIITSTIDTQSDKNNLGNFMPMHYRYMFKRMNQKERPIKLEEISPLMRTNTRSNTFVSAGDVFRTTRFAK